MFCSKCGSAIQEGGSFCPNCGNTVESAYNTSSDQSTIKQSGQSNSQSPKTKKGMFITGIILLSLGALALLGNIFEGDLINAINGGFNLEYLAKTLVQIGLVALGVILISISKKETKN